MSEELAEIKTIGVIGAGTMGTGIAQVAARSGFKVILHDVREEFVSHGKQTINSHLKLEVEKGRLTDELQKQAIKRISTSIDLKTLLGVDLVIEAISENLAKKMEVFF